MWRSGIPVGAAALVPALTLAACGPGPAERRESRPAGAAAPARTAPPTGAALVGAPGTPAFWGDPVLEDGFDGERVDTSKWLVYHFPNAPVNPRTRAATSVADGTLRLTGGIYGGRDLSGGIASHLNQTHGRWEVRMRAEAGQGYSAVALLWPKAFGDPEYAEIDFAEVIDHTRQSVGMFVHHGPDDVMRQRTVRGDFTRWHTFALDWLPNALTFWIDGRKVWSYRGPLTPERSQMGLALQNDQVCDRGPSFCRNRSTPKWVTMYVDWVRVYRAPR